MSLFPKVATMAPVHSHVEKTSEFSETAGQSINSATQKHIKIHIPSDQQFHFRPVEVIKI